MVAARRALAFEQSRRLLLGRGRLTGGVEPSMGKGPAVSRIGVTAIKNASPGVVARIGPNRPSPTAIHSNMG